MLTRMKGGVFALAMIAAGTVACGAPSRPAGELDPAPALVPDPPPSSDRELESSVVEPPSSVAPVATDTPEVDVPALPLAPISGETAVFGTSTGLVAVPLVGGAPTPLTAGSVDWCAIDDRAQVVWLSTTHESGGVSVYDLALYDLALSGPPHVVARDVPIDVDERIIDYGAAGRIGGADPVSFRVALRLDLSGIPALGAAVGCDGDGATYCYQMDAWSEGDPWPPPLVPELEALRQRVAGLAIVDSEAVARVAARGHDRPLHPDSAPLQP